MVEWAGVWYLKNIVRKLVVECFVV